MEGLNPLSPFPTTSPLRVLLSGASGLIGTALSEALTAAGNEVWKLVRRSPAPNSRELFWDPKNGTISAADLEGFDSIVHLGGENIAGGRWTEEFKTRLMKSRVDSTKLLAAAISKLATPPKSFLCASAIGIYGNRGSESLTENSKDGEGFLPEIGRQWEEAARSVPTQGTRLIQLRFGIVLSPRGGAIKKMLLPFLAGVGGVIGNGKQYMSWISLDDAVGAIDFAMRNEKISGPINVVAPHPVTNREFTKTLGRVLKRPTIFPLPAIVIKTIFGEMGETALLGSTRVLPKKLEEAGFQFRYPTLEAALRKELGKTA